MMERGAPVAREMADARCWTLMRLSVRKHLKNTQKIANKVPGALCCPRRGSCGSEPQRCGFYSRGASVQLG